MIGTIWVGALLWLHIMHLEFRAEVDMANRMFHEVPGKLSHLKDFATNYRNYLSAEKITHIDSYDPADKHDDDDDSLKSMVQNGTVDDDKSNEVSEAISIAESADADADADTAAGATSGTGAEPEDDDSSLDDDNVVRSTVGGEVLALQARLGLAAKFQREQNAHDEAIHILFSTDCSVFQDWQALVLFHSAHQVGQLGHITRIASGCDAKAQFELVTLYARLWPVSRTDGWVYSVHFPSDFKAEVAKAYKPFGVQHWLQVNAHPALTKTSIHSRSSSGDGSKTTHPLVGNDTIIALIEPDFLFLRPLTVRLGKNPASLYPPEYTTHQQTEMPDYVQKGNPVGQSVHALGSPWAGPENRQKSKKSLRGREGEDHYFDVEYICGKASACSTVTVKEAAKWYAVGPPYIVHIDDFRQIVDAWVLMVPKIQSGSGSGLPNRIAVVHAYNMAAAHLQLPHTTVLQHLITHVDYSDSEGWKWIDMLGDDVCQPPTENLHDAEKKIFYPMSTLPSLLHYHQYYGIGEYGFYKHKFETKYFQCNSPLLVEPPIDIGKTRVVQKARGAVKVSEINARRNSFMLCTISRVVNDAILDVKVRSCHGGGDSEGNIRDVHDARAGAFKDTYDVVNRNKTINLVLSD